MKNIEDMISFYDFKREYYNIYDENKYSDRLKKLIAEYEELGLQTPDISYKRFYIVSGALADKIRSGNYSAKVHAKKMMIDEFIRKQIAELNVTNEARLEKKLDRVKEAVERMDYLIYNCMNAEQIERFTCGFMPESEIHGVLRTAIMLNYGIQHVDTLKPIFRRDKFSALAFRKYKAVKEQLKSGKNSKLNSYIESNEITVIESSHVELVRVNVKTKQFGYLQRGHLRVIDSIFSYNINC